MAVRFRSHLRLGGCLVALATVLCVLLLAPSAGASGSQPSYLALGDSLAFGDSQAKFNSLYPNENPAAYDTGYVDDFGNFRGVFQPHLQIVNNGCPGETTDLYIKGPCQYQLLFALHHLYSGGPSSSQLSDALAYLGGHPGTFSPITIDIGANDALGLIEGTCKLEPACIAAGAPRCSLTSAPTSG
jgi:hypothetical protein